MNTVILTDTCCDLPLEYVKENNINYFGLTVLYKGSERFDDLWENLDCKEFYDSIRNGETPTTSQINVNTFYDFFKGNTVKGNSIIYIGFSSALSGCVNSAMIAKNMILDEFPNADISVIDSKSASMGEGLIVYYAANMLKSGASKDEIVNWIEDKKLKVNHWFTVDDLFYLKRGGRVSLTSAFIGTFLNIKPVLHVDNEGRLIPVSKAHGRKKSLRILADKFKEMAVNPEEQTIFISHGDCISDAEDVKKMILHDFKVKDVIINPVGPVIGSHSGPGTVALFFIADKR